MSFPYRRQSRSVLLTILSILQVVFVLFTSNSCKASQPIARASSNPDYPIQAIPGTVQTMIDDIVDFDFVVDRDAVLHLVWIARHRSPINGSYFSDKLWYVRSNKPHTHWTFPVLLDSSCSPPVRLAQSPGVLHVIYGPTLGHLQNHSRGGTWMRQRDIYPRGWVEAISITQDTDGSLLAFAARSELTDSLGDRIGTELSLHSATLQDSVVPKTGVIHRFRDRRLQDPHVDCSKIDGHTFAVALVARELLRTRLSPSGSQFTPVRGRLFWSTKSAADTMWTEPIELIAEKFGIQPDDIDPSPIQQMDDVAIAPVQNGVLLGFASFGIHLARLNSQTWRASQVLATYNTATAPTGSPSLEFAGDSLTGLIAWIDERFQKGDRPHGPWSDNRDWANNDVFVVPLSDALTASDPSALRADRITPDLSFAQQLRARADYAMVYLMWSGRTKVGKSRDAFGHPMQLFLTTMTRPSNPRRR